MLWESTGASTGGVSLGEEYVSVVPEGLMSRTKHDETPDASSETRHVAVREIGA